MVPEPVEREEQVRQIDEPGYQRQERIAVDYAAERRQSLYQVSSIIWLVFGVITGLIGLRFVLRLIAANPASPFANLIYRVTDLFLWPFSGLTATPSAGGMVLELSSLIAIAVYLLLAWVLVRLVWVLFDRPGARSVTRYERD
jgi:uncharacterized protein YggT (Ycf19 family)